MLVKVTSKRQVTFPAKVLDELGVKPGDQIELLEGPGRVPVEAASHRLFKAGDSELPGQTRHATVRHPEVQG